MKEAKALEVFADLMIQRIEEMQRVHWECPWIQKGFTTMPININGRKYNGMNTFMLFLESQAKRYHQPVFMTFNQAKKAGVRIKKGEHAFPVFLYIISWKNDTGERLSCEEYETLGDKEDYKKCVTLRIYDVFNIDQTTMEEDNKELYEKFNKPQEEMPGDDGFHVAEIDDMLEENSWLCGIQLAERNAAFYKKSTDTIYLPLKEQFRKGMAFYGTLLHEMAHSTGTRDRLNRVGMSFHVDLNQYGTEELIAEMTAAVVGQQFGIEKYIELDSVAYIKGWLKNIKEKPTFLKGILGDVKNASNKIFEVLNK